MNLDNQLRIKQKQYNIYKNQRTFALYDPINIVLLKIINKFSSLLMFQHVFRSIIDSYNNSYKIMKRMKADRSDTTPVVLASKRYSLNHQQLLTPLKLDLESHTRQNIENIEGKEKNFFKNMRSELTTIKKDFQRLIKKQATLKCNKQDKMVYEQDKPKYHSAYKKQQKRIFYDKYRELEKFDLVGNYRQSVKQKQSQLGQINNKTLNLEKYIQNHNVNDLRNAFSGNGVINTKDIDNYRSFKNMNLIEPYQIPETNYASINTLRKPQFAKQQRMKYNQREEELNKIKIMFSKIQQELKICKQDYIILKKQFQRVRKEREQLSAKNEVLKNQISKKELNIVKENQEKKQILTKTKELQTKCQKFANLQIQINNQRNFYNVKLNQLFADNQNMQNINSQLVRQVETMHINNINLQRFIDNLKECISEKQKDNQRKMQYTKKDLQEYKKREDMFSQQVTKLNQEIYQLYQKTQIQTQNIGVFCEECENSQNKLKEIEEKYRNKENQFKQEMDSLRNELSTQKQLRLSFFRKQDSSNMLNITRQLQNKISSLVDQNCKLKNQINANKSKIESLNQQHLSQKQQIDLYQQREKQYYSNRALHSNQWEQLMEKIESLTEQNQKLTEKLDIADMKREVDAVESIEKQLSNIYNGQNMIKLASTQLVQIQKLKGQIKQLKQQNRIVNTASYNLKLFAVETRRQKDLIENHKGQDYKQIFIKNNELRNDILRLKTKIMNVNKFWFNYAISKVDRKQADNQLQALICKLQIQKQLLFLQIQKY